MLALLSAENVQLAQLQQHPSDELLMPSTSACCSHLLYDFRLTTSARSHATTVSAASQTPALALAAALAATLIAVAFSLLRTVAAHALRKMHQLQERHF
jgi:hypothetical protein